MGLGLCPFGCIRWSHFARLAKDFGLLLDYDREPHSNFAAFYDHYGKVRTHERAYTYAMADGAPDEEEWAAATLYRTFVFRKR